LTLAVGLVFVALNLLLACGLFAAIAFDLVEFEDRRVMDQAVDGRHRHAGVGEDVVPAGERLVGGDQDADVTLSKGDTLHVDIRYVGGATRSLDLPLPKSCVELRTTDAAVVQEIDQLIDTYTDKEIAELLNERGVRTVVTTPWTAARIGRLRHIYRLTDRRTRLLGQGLLTPEAVAARYGVVVSTVHLWRRRGLLRAHPVNDRGDYLYEIPPEDLPAKFVHKRDYQVDPPTSSSHN
jgi:hypothetical protein